MPLTILAQRQLRSKVRFSSETKVNLRENMMSDLSESIANGNVVKAFGLGGRLKRHLGELSYSYADNDVVLETSQSALRSSAAIILVFTQYSFFVLGAIQVLNQGLAFNDFVAQYSMLVLLAGPMNEILDYANKLNQSAASLHRVRHLISLEPEGSQGPRQVKDLGDLSAGVTLDVEDLHFSYPKGSSIFKGLSFRVERGETVAIVGASGSGKTTLFHLLMGFFEGESGRLALNGVDVRELDLEALRAAIGIVFQEQMLFNASVRENLAIGSTEDQVEDEELWLALEQAHAADVVRALPKGLDTMIGSNGIALSGGQRQRLAIARAIVKNPPLLLLDEATSALDSISEGHIQAALKEIYKNRTSLIIAHRLSTITHADKILVMDHGVVAEMGRHEELVERSNLYRSLYEAQVEGFLNSAGVEDV